MNHNNLKIYHLYLKEEKIGLDQDRLSKQLKQEHQILILIFRTSLHLLMGLRLIAMVAIQIDHQQQPIHIHNIRALITKLIP